MEWNATFYSVTEKTIWLRRAGGGELGEQTKPETNNV